MSRSPILPAFLLVLAALSLPVLAGRPARGPGDDFERVVLPILRQRCIDCHAGALESGAPDLSVHASEALALEQPEAWRRIHDRVAARTMPPAGSPPLDDGEREALTGWIEASFDLPTVPAEGEPGRPVLRRLNHTEYRNVVRDLFGVDFPADELFPTENVGHGFDTSGDALSMPDAMFEKYLDAAEEIAGRAIVDPDPGAAPTVRRGPEAFAGDGQGRGEGWVLHSSGGVGFTHAFPRDGEYVLRVRAWAQQAGPQEARMQVGVGGDRGTELGVFAGRDAPEDHEVSVRVARGEHRVEARFVNDYYDPDNPDPGERDRNLHVVWIEVTGPVDPPPITGFQRELFDRFGEDLGPERLGAILEHLARRAWRRPAGVRELVGLERLARDEESLEEGVRLALTAILASPSFLFRPEVDPPGGPEVAARALDGFELATRLSFFLWSSAPDEALLDAAARGGLREDSELLDQVDRLLADPRSSALASGFAAQWLQVRSLDRVAVDEERFPGFDDELRGSMRDETLMFFDAVLREERSVWDLIDGNYTFVDERLARHYGLEGVAGEEMRRVSLDGLPRRGVLTQAAVLTLTSNPNRTSPVKRGKWILETLLGTPPPPPPANIAALDDSEEAVEAASVRERLEQHRRDPSCAACHATMDPLGFGLETFDAVGAWRDRDGSFPVDARGELPDGRSFEGPLELVGLLREEDGFLRCLVEKLFVYALGRGIVPGDRPAVDQVLAELDPEHPTLRAMIEGVVTSTAFRYRSPEVER